MTCHHHSHKPERKGDPISFTIVVPCYNQRQFLADCLESIGSQRYQNWRVIVVDDGSNKAQRVADIVAGLHDDRVSLVEHSANRGLGAARNTGFRLSRSNFVVLVDADDVLYQAYLERVAELLRDRPEVDCVFTDFMLFGARTEIWRMGIQPMADLARRQWIPGPGVTMRPALWERVNGYSEAPALRAGNEDWDFWISAAERGFTAAHIPEPLYRYRRHESSMTNGLRLADHTTREFIYRKHRDWFDRMGAGRRFLGDGYLNSACASLSCGYRARAFYLALRSVVLSPRQEGLKCALRAFRAMAPKVLLSGIRRTRARVNRAFDAPAYSWRWSAGRWAKARRALFWERKASAIHAQWGRSYQADFPVLSRIIQACKPASVLDIGCGSGRLFGLYKSFAIGDILGVDVSAEALDLARRDHPDVPTLRAGLEDVALPRSFDLIVSNRVLSGIPKHAIGRLVEQLCRWGRSAYLNELSDSDGAPESFYWLKHDYAELFARCGWHIVERGMIERQTYLLFRPQ